MAQVKKKEEQTTKKKAQIESPQQQTPEEKRVAELLHFWDEEVSALQGQSFRTEHEAIEAICSRVVARLSTPEGMGDEMRDMLQFFISSDPELCRSIRESLRIDE